MIRMNDFKCKATLKAAAVISVFLLFAAAAAFGQQTINLSAAPTTTTLPDGTTVPMWGYFCGTAATGATATCNPLNPSSAATAATSTTSATPATWSPVLITVPINTAGATSLTINLTNSLSFTPTGATTANTVPTSIVIVGQVGGGLGGAPTTTPSPSHTDAQGCVTWFIAGQNVPPGVPCTTGSPLASPPVQGPRVQSMATEVTAGATTSLTWSMLKPGTYLLESGTHPSIQVPMGLIGVLVVTTAPSGTTAGAAYPATATHAAVPYNAELPLEFSEIDPVQNKEVDQAVRTAGFSETAVWTRMTSPSITSLTLNGGGSGYSYPVVVNFSTLAGNPGGGAAATATLSFAVASATVTSGGAGYAPGDTISLTGGGGSGAVATVLTITGGGSTGPIGTVSVSGGSGYTSAPTVDTTLTGAGSGAALAATLATTGSVATVTLTGEGGAYSAAPTVTVTGGSGSGATVTALVASGGCGTAHTCYPPAVNYTPLYYLIDGIAFNKTKPNLSLFAATAGTTTNATTGVTSPVTTGITGTVLVRLVNAGLRLHVPSITNSLTPGFNGAGTAVPGGVAGFGLIAEDGNVLPNIAPVGATTVPAAPRVQTDVLMVPSKVYDVLVNVPATPTGATAPPSLPVYDRELSLSGNSSVRDAGMLAYISVNGAALPVAAGTGVFAPAQANADIYDGLAPGQPFTVSDPSRGVIANDVNVYGVTLLTAPGAGTLTCGAMSSVLSETISGICANGTFTYTPSGTATSDSFMYCANGTVTGTVCSSGLTATVTLGPSTLTGGPTAITQNYTSTTASFIKIASPGLLLGNTDKNNLTLSVVVPATPPAVTLGASTGTVEMDAQGGFTLSVPGNTSAGTATFSYTVQNSHGVPATGTATVNFPAPSNIKVNVLDAQAYNNCKGSSSCIAGLTAMTDYRWIIEEDQTFWVDPNCTTNSSITTPGCPSIVGPSGQSTLPTFGTQFHTSAMPYVAQGCTGPLSCEGGQTMLDTRPLCTAPGVPAGCSTTAGAHIPAVCDLGNGACRPDPNCAVLPCLTNGGTTPVMPGSVHLDPTKRYYISVLPGDAGNPFPTNANPPDCSQGAIVNGALNTACGHTMSGAPVPPACNILGGSNGCSATSSFASTTVNVLALPTPLPTGKLSVIVFEDDFPLNGEQDGGGGNGTVAPIEPGLGGFNLVLWDTFGGLGDVTGQDSFDMFNQPLSNGLAGTVDPSTGVDACPLTPNPLQATGVGGLVTGNGAGTVANANPTTGITGTIVTCPKYEADGKTLSPLAGQAVIANLMPEKFSVQAYPGADRIARGEQWLQTNTLDGQHAHDSFIRIGEPGYFQEYGPAGYHVSIGFANPAIINARAADVCNGSGTPGSVGPCTNTIQGQVDVERISRTPDQRLYPSGSRDAFAWTQCWVSLGDPDGEDFMFQFCDAQGNFQFSNVPGGQWRVTLGDQWNDQIIDGLSTPANVGCNSNAPNPLAGNNSTTCPGGQVLNLGSIGAQQWQSNLYTRTFLDANKNGIWDAGDVGIPLVYTMIHYRDGHNANALTTDFNGVANFNESYPLFNWYSVESDTGRYKRTGTHTVYDAGGPADGSTDSLGNPLCGPGNGARPCGTSTAYNFFSNTFEGVPLPADLSVPGAVYCATADCTAEAAFIQSGVANKSSSTASTGRIDPPWVWSEGWAGLTGLSNWIDFGLAPYASCNQGTGSGFCVSVPNVGAYIPTGGGAAASTRLVGENGGIHGIVDYASTRPFDDASQMIQQPWEPNVPRVTINLYQEGFAADGVTPTLNLVDTTQTTSWDDWAQGVYPNYTDTTSKTPLPYMNCPGQGTNVAGSANQDLFFYTLFDQPNFLDYYNKLHSIPLGTAATSAPALNALPYSSQYKCYDSMHIANQIQPAPYDGRYFFPSTLGINPLTGRLNTTIRGGVGVPLWSAGTPYSVGNIVMYYGTAYVAAQASTGVAPGTSTDWTVTTTKPSSFVAASMPGTNCTICVGNPDTTDPYRVGTPMLPPGKYTVEVVMPAGYEVYKEEDKNLLIGDNYIAPVTQQFGGLGGSIFIMPDQASVASLYDPTSSGYNPSNFQDETTALGLSNELSGVPGFPGFQDPNWPCVGEMRTVPDYLSLFPQVKEAGPFAGATRPLCDRKEVTLPDQMSVSAKFFIFTSTHIASKYTGGITDDLTSEFDPFSPQFGEKFAPPNMPISTKDYLGNEISRVYSDHWGTYDGLTYSSWEVNPPNITGYSPTIMVQCMNDPGPILDSNASSPTFGQMITDPLYNPAYSNFCYENPYMPGLTTYLDTPVVPTEAFVGAGYNNVDCAYPDATPAIMEVDGDGVGPWVSKSGNTLTITALGTVQVNNSAYSGPSATVAPYNLKTVPRNYAFGSRCTTVGGACTAVSGVTIGGVTATVSSWSPTQIVVTVPTGVPACAIQQQAQYGGPGSTGTSAQCGELVITAGNGKQSVDAVNVTIGGKTPTHVAASASVQAAIDAASPGDLLIIDPTCTATCTTNVVTTTTTGGVTTTKYSNAQASHNEMLIMWKPVRLQGVGAVSSVINASAFPAGKLLDPWRRHINCLFGLTLAGAPQGFVPVGSPAGTAGQVYDSTGAYSCPDVGWNFYNGGVNTPQIDRLPLESVVGWDATQNGNLAEQLQEPSLMGAFEGAAVTVLGKGVDFHGANPWSDGNEAGAFPTTTTLLTGVGPNPLAFPTGDNNPLCVPGNNPFPSNFMCNPSSIDGLTITSSSQGGGGIFIHGWAHHLQVANNRVYNNAGTLTGGINVGQGEFPTPYIQGSTTNAAPGSCSDGTGFVNNQHLPYCLQLEVNLHNNYITNNSSLGDELFSGTLAGGGGVTFCTGNDYYLFNYNWVCGNLSSGEGGGIVHLGEIQNGDIEHNSIVLNQSTNPDIPSNGGGIMVEGTPDTDPICGVSLDADCPPGLSDGTGHNLTINANLIQGNLAESGSGAGIRLQQVNGTDVSTFPGVYAITAATAQPTVTITAAAGATLPALGNSVTVAGFTGAFVGYNCTGCAVTHVTGSTFQYLGTTAGLGTATGTNATGATFTDTTVAGSTAQRITRATDTAKGEITVTSTLSPTVGDRVTITGVTPSGYNCTNTTSTTLCIVTSIPAVGTFTYLPQGSTPLTAASAFGTVVDPSQSAATLWNGVNITNNIIANNVAGWDGAGISLQDALNVNIVHNTITHNDSLASSGVLTQSIGTPGSSAPAGSCVNTAGTASCYQSAGVTTTLNSTLMTTSLTGLTVTCPPGHYGGTTANNGTCTQISYPALYNDLIFENRSFNVGISGAGTGTQNQQNLISLYNGGTSSLVSPQASTGACPTGVTYWDIGVRGDTAPGVGSGFTLSAVNSATTGGTLGSGSNVFISQYCNGSRVAPECTAADGCGGPNGFGVPPGIADATSPNPLFSFTPDATVDEGNNWINVSWGPLTLSNPAIRGATTPGPGGVPTPGNYGGGLALGNYGLAANSPAIDAITASEVVPAGVPLPTTDFYGNPRPNPDGDGRRDYGAVETQAGRSTSAGPTLTSISPNSGTQGTATQPTIVNVALNGTNLTGAYAVTVSGTGITVSGIGAVSSTVVDATFTIASTAATTTRTVTVTTPNGTSGSVNFTVTAPTAGATLAFVLPGANNTTNPSMNTGGTTVKNSTVTVENTAGAGAGSITLTANPSLGTKGGVGGITGTGTFSIVTGGTCVSGFVINPGSSCTILVRYTPLATGLNNTSTATDLVNITGTGFGTSPAASGRFSAN
jgi:hypothetical protein